jgi:shikimate dehydrogenase
MHMAEGARLGLDYSYALADFDLLKLAESAIAAALRLAGQYGFAGLNVTHPFKQRILAELHELSPEAADIGAANTVLFREGRTVGHNTDCWGFAESFRRGMPGAKLGAVLLLGAGGAGKAVARALADLGAGGIEIFDPDAAKSESLAARIASGERAIRASAVYDLARAARIADGLVNASPVGMAGYAGLPLSASLLRPEMWVADIVYFPAETELLRTASAAGCRTLPGEGMAIFQAVKAFELITGRAADPAEMSRHFHSPARAGIRSD